MPLSRYLKIYPDLDHPGHVILYSTRKGSIVRLPETLLTSAADGTLPEKQRQTLARLGMIIDDPSAEQLELAGLVKRANSRSAIFKGTVVLNLACNLACTYCYEEGFRGNLHMADSTAGALIDWVATEQMQQGRDVEIHFYGGEPLLSLPLIHAIASQLCDAAASFGSKFSISMTTNGTLLTRAVVQQLLPYNFTSAVLTLDGPAEVHDIQRPFVSGKGSFDTIVANILDVHDLIRIRLGGNFTRDNYRAFPHLLDHLLSKGLTPDKLGLVQFFPVTPKSGRGADLGSGCISSSEPWLMEAAPYLRGEIIKRDYKTSKPTMAACVIEFENDIVINYDGSLYKCPALIGWPELSVGTLEGGIRDYSVSHNLALWHNDKCLDCAYLPLCFGGCRLNPLLKNGSIDEVDCRREFYDVALEQFILQDLARR